MEEVVPQAPVARRELDLLNRLAPLVASPRAATRLFNIYGMLRSATDLAPGKHFLGQPGKPGTYQAVAQLLGVLSADPELFAVLLYGRTAPHQPDVVGLGRTDPTATTWPDLVDGLHPNQDEHGAWSNGVAATMTDDEVERWRRIHRSLGALGHVVILKDLEPYQEWGPLIARFSFHLEPTSTSGYAPEHLPPSQDVPLHG